MHFGWQLMAEFKFYGRFFFFVLEEVFCCFLFWEIWKEWIVFMLDGNTDYYQDNERSAHAFTLIMPLFLVVLRHESEIFITLDAWISWGDYWLVVWSNSFRCNCGMLWHFNLDNDLHFIQISLFLLNTVYVLSFIIFGDSNQFQSNKMTHRSIWVEIQLDSNPFKLNQMTQSFFFSKKGMIFFSFSMKTSQFFE